MSARGRDASVATAATVLAAVVAAALFYEGAALSLSITGRALVLAAFLVAVVVLAASYPAGAGVGIAAIVAGLVTGIYGGYALGHEGPVGAVVALGVMALVSAVVYAIQEGRLYLSRRTAHAFLAVLAFGAVAFVGVDLQYGEVSYELELEEQVTAPANASAVAVGQVTASNSFVFREPADYPDVRACLYAGGERSDLGWVYEGGTSFFGRTVPSEGTRTVPLQALFGPDQAAAVSGSLPVERRDACPESRDADGIVVVFEPASGG